MKKILLIMLPILLIVSGPAYGLYWVDVEPDKADNFPYVYFQFDSNDVHGFDKTDFRARWDETREIYYSWAYAGRFALDFYDVDQSGSGKGPNWQFSAFGYCVDLLTGSGDDLADTRELLAANEEQVAWLMNYTPPSNLLTNSKTDNAVLQLAIWEAFYGDRFFVRPGLNAPEMDLLYAHYMSALGDNQYSGDEFGYVDFQSNVRERQDMIFRVVPEPATMLLMGLGFIGLAGIGAKRRKARNN